MQYLKNLSFFIFLVCIGCSQKEIELKPGMTINHSVKIKPGTYLFSGNEDLEIPIITIEGKNIEIDFNGAILKGSKEFDLPNEFQGLGILVKKCRERYD